MKSYSKSHSLLNGLRLAILGLVFGLAAGSAVSANSYHVGIDSISYSGTGWLDLQFNPGNGSATNATATLTNFVGLLDGTQTSQVFGSVSGTLPSAISFGNDTAFNDLFQAVVLGTKLSFDLNFGGAFLNTAGNVGTSFAVALYGNDQMSPLGTVDPVTGSLVIFNLMPSTGAGQPGQVAPMVFDGAMAQVAAVPEPETYAMLLAGLMMLGFLIRKRTA